MAKPSSDETDFHLTQSLIFNGKQWIKPSGRSSSGTQNSTQSFTPRYVPFFHSNMPFSNQYTLQNISIFHHISISIVTLIFLDLKKFKRPVQSVIYL